MGTDYSSGSSMTGKLSKTALLIPCVSRKSSACGQPVPLGDLNDDDFFSLAKKWFVLLDSNSAGCHPLDNLYQGPAWSAYKNLGQYFDNVFVLSAGFGIVPISSAVRPYDATFTALQRNSIPLMSKASQSDANRAWLKAITACSDNPTEPLEVSELLHNYDFVLIALPSAYLKVLQPELVDAMTSNRQDFGRFLIAGIGIPPRELADVFLSVNADLARHYGSTLGALLPVALTDAFSECKTVDDLPVLQRFFDSIHVPAKIHRKKVQASDEVILNEIEGMIATLESKELSASRCLRRLRDTTDYSCEQKRFGRLFKQAMGARRADMNNEKS